jgi:hypothetical protein
MTTSYLGHPGINRTKETIGQHLWWPNMGKDITLSVSTCKNCQRNKCRHKKYGHLQEKEAEAMPWDKMCINLIGLAIYYMQKGRMVLKYISTKTNNQLQ